MSPVSEPSVVSIVGPPVACAEGVKETWREVGAWAAAHLKARYGEAAQLHYVDLFDPACPPLPPGAQLPVVLLNGEMVSSGGNVSLPAINRRLEGLGVLPRVAGMERA